MPTFFYDLSKNIIRCFTGYNLLFQLAAIVNTKEELVTAFRELQTGDFIKKESSSVAQ